jgi:hypothetical protein
MTPSTAAESELAALHQVIADRIRFQNRSLIAELHIEPCDGGLAIRGRTASYFGKQIAFYEVERQCKQNVVRNQIAVV